MMTIFSVPKPFEDEIGIIQRNAIASWTRLRPACEIVLCGNDKGVAEVAAEFGARHLADVECNEYGTPLLNSVFSRVAATSAYPLLCYVNTDIILLNDLVEAIRGVRRRRFFRFLMLGQRWNLDLQESLDFSRPNWEEQLRASVAAQGNLQPPLGSDYFIFPRRIGLAKLPPFAVGRPTWDNWLIFRARQLRIPVIDATQSVMAIHQNHDYKHVPHSRQGIWDGPEGDVNRSLTGGAEHIFTLDDATHLLTAKGLGPALTTAHLKRRYWHAVPILFPKLKPLMQVLYKMRGWLVASWRKL